MPAYFSLNAGAHLFPVFQWRSRWTNWNTTWEGGQISYSLGDGWFTVPRNGASQREGCEDGRGSGGPEETIFAVGRWGEGQPQEILAWSHVVGWIPCDWAGCTMEFSSFVTVSPEIYVFSLCSLRRRLWTCLVFFILFCPCTVPVALLLLWPIKFVCCVPTIYVGDFIYSMKNMSQNSEQYDSIWMSGKLRVLNWNHGLINVVIMY